MNICDGTWFPIPCFEGFYVINHQGMVCNIHGHPIKPIQTSSGLYVELHRLGQRERIMVIDLLRATFGESYENV